MLLPGFNVIVMQHVAAISLFGWTYSMQNELPFALCHGPFCADSRTQLRRTMPAPGCSRSAPARPCASETDGARRSRAPASRSASGIDELLRGQCGSAVPGANLIGSEEMVIISNGGRHQTEQGAKVAGISHINALKTVALSRCNRENLVELRDRRISEILIEINEHFLGPSDHFEQKI
jgi:hypothetical protein